MIAKEKEPQKTETLESLDSEYIEQAIRICDRAAKGDLEARISGIDCEDETLNRLFHSINHVLDVADSYTREAAAATQCCSEGKFHRPILLRGLKGAYKDSARKINTGALKMLESSKTIEKLEDERKEIAASAQKTAESVMDSVGELNQVSTIIGQNAEQTLRLANSVSDTSKESASNIGGISAACEELAVTTSEISNQTGKTEDLAKETEGAVATFSEMFEEMRSSISKITPVVALIQRISSQTNLLSLNATIEASRAGEAGKGFAVVANEVKELSKSTALATGKIQKQVDLIEGTTQRAVEGVDAITQSVSKINQFAKAINNSLTEQSIASEEIARSVSNVSSAAAQVSADIGGVSESANAARETTRSVDRIMQELSGEAQILSSEVSKLLQ